MTDYDPDEYEYQQLLAERRHARRKNKYYDYRDPEAPDFPEEEDESEHPETSRS